MREGHAKTETLEERDCHVQTDRKKKEGKGRRFREIIVCTGMYRTVNTEVIPHKK
jgi:hypothetical protein